MIWTSWKKVVKFFSLFADDASFQWSHQEKNCCLAHSWFFRHTIIFCWAHCPVITRLYQVVDMWYNVLYSITYLFLYENEDPFFFSLLLQYLSSPHGCSTKLINCIICRICSVFWSPSTLSWPYWTTSSFEANNGNGSLWGVNPALDMMKITLSAQREGPEEVREEGKWDLPVHYNNKFPSCCFPAMIWTLWDWILLCSQPC